MGACCGVTVLGCLAGNIPAACCMGVCFGVTVLGCLAGNIPVTCCMGVCCGATVLGCLAGNIPAPCCMGACCCWGVNKPAPCCTATLGLAPDPGRKTNFILMFFTCIAAIVASPLPM